MDKAKVKAWINKGGLVAIIVGVIAFVATGGDAETAGRTVTIVAGVTGTVMIFIRELLG